MESKKSPVQPSISPLDKGGWGIAARGPYIPYDRQLTELARNNRNNPTSPERRMWCEILKQDQYKGCRFLRQKPIGRFIVDFYCPTLSLAIEIDGDTHSGQEAYDAERTEYLERLGITVVRFDNTDVMRNLEGVHRALTEIIEQRKGAIPLPPLSRGPEV